MIDESYDDEPNSHRRWQAAWKQVENLCKLDPYYVYWALESILDHNQKHFLETNWHQSVCNEALKDQ